MAAKTTDQLIAEMDYRISQLARVVADSLQNRSSPFREVETPPNSFEDTGAKGDICFAGDYVYYCYQENKWQKWIAIKEF